MGKLTSEGLEKRPESDFDIATARPLGPETVRGGVCLICGDGVLNNGEHIDPERHEEALKTPLERLAETVWMDEWEHGYE